MAVRIDKEACIGCGICETICPDLFGMGTDDKAYVKDLANPDKELTQEAIDNCPVKAIEED